MKVMTLSGSLEEACLLAAPLERSTARIVFAIHSAARLTPAPALWPAPADPAADEAARLALSQELESHFRDMRRRAREGCPPPMLLSFEDELRELEANVRAAVTGRLSLFVDYSYHIRLVEDFSRKWVPYVDPPPAPPPRVRCDEADRSVWLDEKCIASGLKRDEFEYFRALAKAYPNTLVWRLARTTLPGFRGKNQSRFKKKLSAPIRRLIETTSSGSVLRLPAKTSTTV